MTELGNKVREHATTAVQGIGKMVIVGMSLSAGNKAFEAMLGVGGSKNDDDVNNDFNATAMHEYMARQDRDYYTEEEIAKWKAENNINVKISTAFPKPLGETMEQYHSRISKMKAMERELLDAKYDDLEKEQRKRDESLNINQDLWHAKWEKQEDELQEKEKKLRQREYEIDRMEANAKAAADKAIRDKEDEIWKKKRAKEIKESKKVDDYNADENFEVQTKSYQTKSLDYNTDRVGMLRDERNSWEWNDQKPEKRDLLNELSTFEMLNQTDEIETVEIPINLTSWDDWFTEHEKTNEFEIINVFENNGTENVDVNEYETETKKNDESKKNDENENEYEYEYEYETETEIKKIDNVVNDENENEKNDETETKKIDNFVNDENVNKKNDLSENKEIDKFEIDENENKKNDLSEKEKKEIDKFKIDERENEKEERDDNKKNERNEKNDNDEIFRSDKNKEYVSTTEINVHIDKSSASLKNVPVLTVCICITILYCVHNQLV